MSTAVALFLGILVLPGLLWRSASRGGLSRFDFAAAVSLPSGLLAMAALFIWTKAEVQLPWSACRLAPALGILRGFPLYSPAGHGPINGWLYGPVAALFWLPAGFCRTAMGALAVSEALNLLLLILPLFVVCLLAAGNSAGQRVLAVWCAIGAAASLVFFYPTWYMTIVLTADAAAVGLGALGCMVLSLDRPARGRLALAAGLTAASIWSKQISAPLVVVQLAWLVVAGRGALAPRYSAWLFCWIAGLGLAFACAFGAREMYFNMWIVPSSQFLVAGWSEGASRAGFFLLATLPATGLALWAWLDGKAGERRRTVPILGFAALALLPVGILTSLKVGAETNSIHSYYFAVAAAAAAATSLAAARQRRYSPAIFLVAAGCLAAAPFVVRARRDGNAPTLRWDSNEAAFEFERARPGEVYFPWDPLAALLAENRFYHFEYGVIDRMYAGIRPSDEQLREGLPPRLRLMIYPPISRLGTMVQLCGPNFGLNGMSQMGQWTLFHYGAAAPVDVARPRLPK